MAHEVTTTVEIAATPENVWAVLADLDSYPRWHPAFLSVTGQLAPGSTLTITTTHPANGRKMTGKVKVRTVEPGRELRWVSKLAGMTISERVFRLSPAADGTALVQSGTYRGIGGSRGGRLTTTAITRIRDAFEAINQAAKQQAEARQRDLG
jgi:hypothetical protein